MRKIVIDIYGADAGASVIVNGVIKAIKDGVDFFPVMVGEKALIDGLMAENGIENNRYEVVDTDKYITAHDPANCIFGGCDDTSMAMGYERLKGDDECCAMLSAGNTGALLVGSICRLGLVSGVRFPALGSAIPCVKDKLICLVDCGSNTDCTASDLERYAVMGNIFSKAFCAIENPRVGLMSVGREKEKGSKLIYEAYEKISALPINFVGNLEGSDVVSGYADVIVSDGFSGNVLLKCTEAVGKAAMEVVKEVACDNEELAKKINEELFKRFDFNSQGAATFLGPKKTVVKMHGCANENTTVASIKQILKLEDGDFCKQMAQAFAK